MWAMSVSQHFLLLFYCSSRSPLYTVTHFRIVFKKVICNSTNIILYIYIHPKTKFTSIYVAPGTDRPQTRQLGMASVKQKRCTSDSFERKAALYDSIVSDKAAYIYLSFRFYALLSVNILACENAYKKDGYLLVHPTHVGNWECCEATLLLKRSSPPIAPVKTLYRYLLYQHLALPHISNLQFSCGSGNIRIYNSHYLLLFNHR